MFPKTERRSVFQRENKFVRVPFSNVKLKLNMAFFRTPCKISICWGVSPKPHWGFHPQTPERGRPRGQKDTDYINL